MSRMSTQNTTYNDAIRFNQLADCLLNEWEIALNYDGTLVDDIDLYSVYRDTEQRDVDDLELINMLSKMYMNVSEGIGRVAMSEHIYQWTLQET